MLTLLSTYEKVPEIRGAYLVNVTQVKCARRGCCPAWLQATQRRIRMLRRTTLVLAALALLLFSLPRHIQGQGQGVYGAVDGNVTDPTKAAIPNARVTATNTATGVETSVTS